MKFKRGLLVFLAIALFFLIISSVSAEFLSVSELVQSEWINAALLFLVVFNFVLFVLKDVFKGSYGAAIVIAIVVGLASSLAVVYYFGAFLADVGVWLLVVFVVAIAILVFRLTRKSKATGIAFWILGIVSAAWLAFLHKPACPPVGPFPEYICQILDILAIVFLIICLIKLIKWFIMLFKRKGDCSGGGRRRGGGDGDDGKPGNLTGYVRDRTTNRGISGATVEVHGGRTGQQTTTDSSGHYNLQLPGRKIKLFNKPYGVQASASGFESGMARVMIRAGRATHQDFYLNPTSTPGMPQIVTFTAVPNPVTASGNTTNLRWNVRDVNEIQIQQQGATIHHLNGIPGNHVGNHNSNPVTANPTRFRLMATNARGSVQREVVVPIGGTPPPGDHLLEVEQYIDGHVDVARAAGEIRIRPGNYPHVRSPSVPFTWVRENDPPYRFDHWEVENLTTHARVRHPRGARGAINFRRDMDDNYRVEGHFVTHHAGDPEITSLRANPHNLPAPGNTRIEWQTRNADEVYIDGIGRVATGAAAANGSRVINNVSATTTYHVSAKNTTTGKTSPKKDVTVTVGSTPPDSVHLVVTYDSNEGSVRRQGIGGGILTSGVAYTFRRSDAIVIMATPNPGYSFPIKWRVFQNGKTYNTNGPLPIHVLWKNDAILKTKDTIQIHVDFSSSGGGTNTFTVSNSSVRKGQTIVFSWSSRRDVNSIILILEKGKQLRLNKSGSHSYTPEDSFRAWAFFRDSHDRIVEKKHIDIRVSETSNQKSLPPGSQYRKALPPGERKQLEEEEKRLVLEDKHYERLYAEKTREKEMLEEKAKRLEKYLRDIIHKKTELRMERLQNQKNHQKPDHDLDQRIRSAEVEAKKTKDEIKDYERQIVNLQNLLKKYKKEIESRKRRMQKRGLR